MKLNFKISFISFYLCCQKNSSSNELKCNFFKTSDIPSFYVAWPLANSRQVTENYSLCQGAQAWLKDTECGLELYLDPGRVLYSGLGLARSVWKVWQMRTLQYYGGMKAQGRQLPMAVEGVEDDPLQMGGDFTFRWWEEVAWPVDDIPIAGAKTTLSPSLTRARHPMTGQPWRKY